MPLQAWGRNGKLEEVIMDIVTLLQTVDVLLVQEWGDHVDGCYHGCHNVAA